MPKQCIIDVSVKILINQNSFSSFERTEAFEEACVLTESSLRVRIMPEIFKLIHSNSSFGYTNPTSLIFPPFAQPFKMDVPKSARRMRSALGSPAGLILNPDFT